MTAHELSRPEWDRRFAALTATVGTEAAIYAMHTLHGPRDSTFPNYREGGWGLYHAARGVGITDHQFGAIAVTPPEARRLAAALVVAADWLDAHGASS